jgi:hypothetical protein
MGDDEFNSVGLRCLFSALAENRWQLNCPDRARGGAINGLKMTPWHDEIEKKKNRVKGLLHRKRTRGYGARL